MKLQKTLIGLSTVSLILFGLILFGVAANSFNGFFVRMDSAVNLFMPAMQNGFLVGLSKIIDVAFSTWVMAFVSLIIAAVIWFKLSKKDAIFFALVMLAESLIVLAIKNIVRIQRPSNALIAVTDFSFPSGHATVAFVFFGLLTYFILRKSDSPALKDSAIIIFFLLILLVGFSRILLNVHWLTDVIAGFAVGAVIMATGILIKEHI